MNSTEDLVVKVIRLLSSKQKHKRIADDLAHLAQLDHKHTVDNLKFYVGQLQKCTCLEKGELSGKLDDVEKAVNGENTEAIGNTLALLEKNTLYDKEADKLIKGRQKLVAFEQELSKINKQCQCKYQQSDSSKQQSKPRAEISEPRAPSIDGTQENKRQGGDKTQGQTQSVIDKPKSQNENDPLKEMIVAKDNKIADLESELAEMKTKANHGSHKQSDDLRRTIQDQKREIDELKTRLSALASGKLRENNPNITDLSDPYRPIKLGEIFRQAYDNEWTVAYEDLDSLPESKIISFLAETIMTVKGLCKVSHTRLIEDVTNGLLTAIKTPTIMSPAGKEYSKDKQFKPISSDLQHVTAARKYTREATKGLATLAIPYINAKFNEEELGKLMKKWSIKEATGGIKKYVARIVECLWLMEVQDPPMDLLWKDKGDTFDKDRFSFYTSTGSVVAQCVWPAVLLHQDGPLMTKGIAQGMTN